MIAAGCEGGESASKHPSTAAVRVLPPKRAPALRPGVKLAVFDGDLGRPVRGAKVRITRQSATANRRGVAILRPRHRRLVSFHVSARGYEPRVFRINVRRRPLAGVRIFRKSLQWPMYGADPARTQAQPHIHLRPPFRIVWSRPLGGLLEFPAVVVDGVAYVTNGWGSVRALSMRNGASGWRFDIPHGKSAASPAVVGDLLVVHGMDGNVWVFDRDNGRLLWRRPIGSPIESSPSIWRGVDYFGAWNGNIYALDLRSRRLRWVHRGGYKVTSSVSRLGGTLYVGDYGGRVLALSARSGRLRWGGSVNGRVYGTLAVAGRRVFVPSSSGASVTAFSTRGRRLWTLHTGSYVYSSPAVWGGRVFFGSHNRSLYCVSAANGRVLWRYPTSSAIAGAPAVVGKVVYFGTLRSGITALDARSGRRLYHFPDGQYVPVSGNGGQLLLHGYSRLYAVAPKRR